MLGGLIASYDNWAAFADEWHSELSKPPGANYFKLSQALSLTDEFDESKGWTVALRDDRVYALAVIARRHALCGISCTLDESLYDEFVRSFSSFKELRDPYFLCFHQMVDAITSARGEFPEATGLDYVFDEQGDVGLNAVYWWKRLKAILPFRAPSLVGSTPVSRDEKKFRPLQAADLYAGLQRHQLEHAGEVMPTVAKALEAFRGFKAWQRSYSKEDLMALGADLIIKKAAHRERRQREGEG